MPGFKRNKDGAPLKRMRPSPVQGGRHFARSLNSRSNSPEVKCVDIEVAAAVINTTPRFTILNNIVKGTDFYNRIGTKVAMRSLYMNGYISSDTGSSNVDDYVRLIVVYDRQANGALPSGSTLLQDVSATGFATTNSLSGLSMINRERFLILSDTRVFLPSPSGTTGVVNPDPVSATYRFNKYINLRKLIAQYNTTNGGTVADITSGSLFFYTVGAAAPGAENYQYQGTFRLKYDDL